ncbi:MAG: hypothetical protein P1P67_10970 [Treponema phagedenis]|uniref:Uncharacterized protein n=1 Tax=Treponema phagedenis TaxID=162 RepID=A0A0B7GUK8_TREPH|nr:hypothetical protein [Treponema phagedenis]CEM61222.1 hypothetical protein TPHV1_160023 [Treponema phagedenis]
MSLKASILQNSVDAFKHRLEFGKGDNKAFSVADNITIFPPKNDFRHWKYVIELLK